MYGISYFEVEADDPEKAVRFYQKVFGWHFMKDKEMPIPYWRIETDGMRGGLIERIGARPLTGEGASAFVCSVLVDNFDAVATKVVRNGGKVVRCKFPVPGVCWQGYFTDPEGNTFGLFQPDVDAE